MRGGCAELAEAIGISLRQIERYRAAERRREPLPRWLLRLLDPQPPPAVLVLARPQF